MPYRCHLHTTTLGFNTPAQVAEVRQTIRSHCRPSRSLYRGQAEVSASSLYFHSPANPVWGWQLELQGRGKAESLPGAEKGKSGDHSDTGISEGKKRS